MANRGWQKVDMRYRQIEAELYNLWPAVGLVNQARSNYRFSAINSGTKDGFYGCDFTYDKSGRHVEPADAAKGIVARANLFVAEHYGIQLSDGQRHLFIAWSKEFPPSSRELVWAARVTVVEGYRNPYIEGHS